MAKINQDGAKLKGADSWLVVFLSGGLIIGAIALLIRWAVLSAYAL